MKRARDEKDVQRKTFGKSGRFLIQGSVRKQRGDEYKKISTAKIRENDPHYVLAELFRLRHQPDAWRWRWIVYDLKAKRGKLVPVVSEEDLRRMTSSRDESRGDLSRLRAANNAWLRAMQHKEPRATIAAIRRFIPEARAFGNQRIPESEGGGTGNSRARSASRELRRLRTKYAAQLAKSRRGKKRPRAATTTDYERRFHAGRRYR